MSEALTSIHPAGSQAADTPQRRLHWSVRTIGWVAVTALVLEVGLRVVLSNAQMSPPVFALSSGPEGYGLLPSVSARVRQFGRTVTLTTNADGRRVTPGAPTGAPKLHLVGDSQVFGWGLDDSETLGAQLQRALGDRVQVVNHGVPGYGPDEYLAVLKRLPQQDVVVVVSTEENDGGDAYGLGKKANVACGFIASFEQDGPLRCALMSSRLVQAAFVVINDLHHRYHMTPLGFADHSQVAGEVIHWRVRARMQAAAAARSGKTIYSVVPWKGRYSDEWRSRYAPPPVPQPRERSTPFMDSTQVIQAFAQRADASAWYLQGDTHLSPAGVAGMTEAIRSALVAALSADPSQAR
jgi:hypothetical protein